MWQLLKGSRLTGLRARLLGIVLVAVVPLVALLFVYASVQNTAAQDLARAEVQRSLLSDREAIRDLVSESRATLVTFGITYAIQQRRIDLAQGNAERLKALHPVYEVIAVADPDGRIIVSSTQSTGSVDIADRPFFQRALVATDVTVAGLQADPLLGRPTVKVTYPVFDASGTLIAVEYIGFDPARLAERLSARGSRLAVELLVDGDGTVVAREPDLPGAVGEKLPSSELMNAMIEGGRGDIVTDGLDGVPRRYYLAPVFEASVGELYLASGFSEQELLASQRRTLALVLTGFAAFALFALGVAWAVGTFSIYRPLRMLGDAAERLAEGDLSARSHLSARGDVIGALGREFDHMAEEIERHVRDLEHTQRELSSLNTELESRVRRRTAELEATNRELEAFNYSVSHDLRAPLRAIDGFSQALLEDYADHFDEEGREHLHRVKAAANRMGELIDSLLTLSRLSRCDMVTHQVDLSAIAADVVHSLRREQPDRSVDVTIPPSLIAECDPVLIRSVLENLLGNAWKFTGRTADARIEVGSEVVDGEPAYFVRDNGAGFDMAYSNKLFGAFQRLHGQSEFPGVGVGLATVSRIIWRHGGRVWAHGEPGMGATFYFTLP